MPYHRLNDDSDEECRKYNAFLQSLTHAVIKETNSSVNIPYAGIAITDYTDGTLDDSDTICSKTNEKIIPPLNTDLRMEKVLPEYSRSTLSVFGSGDSSTEQELPENFSWHIITSSDSNTIVAKKKLINPVQNQHMCGSCWAMALSACISDCFVVGGTVNWMPRIAPTYLMMTIPSSYGNGRCNGGNPAKTALALESIPVTDTTCVDYSWCANEQTCTSSTASSHFKGNLGDTLNKNIPYPSKSCYFEGDRYMYQIDRGTEALFINSQNPPDVFRKTVKRHILEYGPPLAGYAVYKNFITGNFTDPSVNQGVYFERANYPSDISSDVPLVFDDDNTSEYNLVGLHAVEIVGWGLAKRVQYDYNSYGDVPFWWAKNSWGTRWGNSGGYFKIAMYPWNKFAQFGRQINVKDATVGGVIMIRCTKQPTIEKLSKIPDRISGNITKMMPQTYYMKTPQDISHSSNTESEKKTDTDYTPYYILAVVMIVVLAVCILIITRAT